jgi:stage V sporulation protein B
MKDKFLRGALILTVAGLIVKIFGSVNRIILSRLLGGEGIGLYQMAYPFYLLMLSISAAGVPVAVSIVVAEKVAKNDYPGAHKVFLVTLKLMMAFGLFFALLLYLSAGFMIDSGMIRDSRAYYALVVLTPAVFFSSILASFRGYFQGYQLMTPPAISQIIEQFVRVMAMVILAYVLLPYGLTYAAAGAAFGAIPGSLAGLIVLTFFYRRLRKQRLQSGEALTTTGETEPLGKLAKRLILLAIPVSCANLLIPVTSSIDMIMVPNCLGSAGFSVAEATTLFGYLAGMAQPLLMMSLIPTISIAASLVPSVTETMTIGNFAETEHKIALAIKICLLITVPATIGLIVLAEPVAKVLYGTVQAAPVIANLAPSIIFLGIFQVTTGALQGLGQTAIPMWNMLGGAVVRVVAIWLLTSTVTWNILGAAWASNINYLVVAAINIFVLWRSKVYFPWLGSFKILAAAVAMGIVTYLVYMLTRGAGAVVGLIASMLVGVVVYVGMIMILGILTAEEAGKVPFLGKRLQRFMHR